MPMEHMTFEEMREKFDRDEIIIELVDEDKPIGPDAHVITLDLSQPDDNATLQSRIERLERKIEGLERTVFPQE